MIKKYTRYYTWAEWVTDGNFENTNAHCKVATGIKIFPAFNCSKTKNLALYRIMEDKNPQTSFFEVSGGQNSAVKIEQMVLHGKKPGPVVWLTAGIHGDESGCVRVVREVIKRLKNGKLRCGTVYAFPLLNYSGSINNSRLIPKSQEDLNRLFPGNKDGSLGERIAHAVFSKITESNPVVVLDIHDDIDANWIKSVSYVLVDPKSGFRSSGAYKATNKLAEKTGLMVVREEKTKNNEWKKTLSGSLILNNIPSMTIELGNTNTSNKVNVNLGITSVWNALASLGIVEPKQLNLKSFIKNKFSGKPLVYSDRPRIKMNGVIKFLIKPGDVVKRGQIIAEISNKSRKTRGTAVKAMNNGILLGHANQNVAHPGFKTFSFAVVKNSSTIL
ncbi:MAG: succinylglutamate desuccinylase/aspartoacylase family protein [Patescibacteria group bacterium]